MVALEKHLLEIHPSHSEGCSLKGEKITKSIVHK